MDGIHVTLLLMATLLCMRYRSSSLGHDGCVCWYKYRFCKIQVAKRNREGEKCNKGEWAMRDLCRLDVELTK